MSTTVKFTISDEKYNELCSKAAAMGLSVQDYIRKELFNDSVSLTPMDAVSRALKKFKKGDRFTVPEIFGDEWNLPNGVAGQFGKKFRNLVETNYSTKIRFTGNYTTEHAIYEIV